MISEVLKNNNTLTYSSDSVKYNVSTVFPSQAYIAYTRPFTSSELLNEATICAWFKHSYTGTSDADIFAGAARMYLYYQSANTYKCRLSWGHAASASSYSTNTSDMGIVCPANTWMHVVWTFKDGYLKSYVNGVYNTYSDRTGTGQYMMANYYTKQIGSANYVGKLSDVRFYTTALTDQQILELYNERR